MKTGVFRTKSIDKIATVYNTQKNFSQGLELYIRFIEVLSRKINSKTRLSAVSLWYPAVLLIFTEIFNFCAFVLKTTTKLCFPHTCKHKNRHIILVCIVYTSNVVAKVCVNMFIFIYAGSHLGFRQFRQFPEPKTNNKLFFFILMIFRIRIKWRINVNRHNTRKFFCDI